VTARLFVKICGVRSVEDARACVDAGADAVGVTFVDGSRRRTTEEVAAEIVRAVGARVRVVGVFADASVDHVRGVRARTGIAWAQLHGDEPPDAVAALGPYAYKALRARDESVIAAAARYEGRPLLVDAWAPGVLGGSGAPVDRGLARRLAETREVLLAGGLTPLDVADAVREVGPWGVDVASGVESAPGVKDAARIRAFVQAARSGARELG